MNDINRGRLPSYTEAGQAGSVPGAPGDALRDGYAAVLTADERSNDPWIEGEIYNPLLADAVEPLDDGSKRLDHEVLFFMQALKVPDPQTMRRFIAACMEKNVNEKDLIWLYHMRDLSQTGTLPKKVFIEITKQQLSGNSQLTRHEDYDLLATSYRAFGSDYVRYVQICNHLHAWRIKFSNYKEFPQKQLYPPYRYPLKEMFPLQRPSQGTWQVDARRRASHCLPTMTADEINDVPRIVQNMARALSDHQCSQILEHFLFQQEQLKEDKSIECGLMPHDYAKSIIREHIPYSTDDKELELLCLYYEHPFILHFFRYKDFLRDLTYEMGEINEQFKERPEHTRLQIILSRIKRYLHEHGINLIEPLKDFDRFGEGRLNKSQMQRALHILKIGFGQRCHISNDDMEFLLNAFSSDGINVDYRSMVADMMQVFVEQFQPGKRLSMVMESFEQDLSLGPFYPPRTPLLTKEQILTKPSNNQQFLGLVLNRLKMLIAQRRINLESVFRSFDPHHIRHIQSPQVVPRILQLCGLPVSPHESDVITERFCDEKGFRYMDFLEAIDTQSYGHWLPSYPLSLATMEKWKAHRAWYSEVLPQDPYQEYQGPDEIVEKCRRIVKTNRLRVRDFFTDQDFHHRGTVSRKQFRRATTAMHLGLSPIENLLLEDRYAYAPDVSHIDFIKFVADMDVVFVSKGAHDAPALTPVPYVLSASHDRGPIEEGNIKLAQEAFRKIAEKVLELRIHILPYFQDFDKWRHGGITPGRFRRIFSDLGLDILTEFEWRALFKYFTRKSKGFFDYEAFLSAISDVKTNRSTTAAIDPRCVPLAAAEK
ncbi:LOW QUALITY PROTEIN: uncharacterized protein LOC129590169 [Paramacrobiotus metropolitanus]|uniref:LOW QUALITY PROTEIN: uncharacterized protein LOC129590169 n=1 Tax=Paramacrobiotus metropolitanus TaxID=2943436 RepID=UPI0024460544|nr:LOW QUALITY PROTEIN: uncharacterized protein LOC129590169 [Paramacrobiotus metropolitanus]